MLADKALTGFVADRYSSWKRGVGVKILKGQMDTRAIEKWVLRNGEPTLRSGRQEMLEILFNDNL
jgi:xylose isomerase